VAPNPSTLRAAHERDLYALLGVDPGATTDAITLAFRARAKELHPDRAPDDPEIAERFKELSEAYATLTRPDRRARYDARRAPRAAAAPEATGSPKSRTQPVLATRGRARAAVIGGLVCILLGVAISPVLLSIDTSPDTLGRDVTLWIVVAKLLICGAVLVAAGWWRMAMLGPSTPEPVPTRR
jgi:hypothetical protein